MRILVEDAGQVRGVAQVLLRPAGFGRQVAYVRARPGLGRAAPDADRVFAWLLQGLRRLARRERALVVKMDPRAEPGEAFDFAHLADEHGLRRAPDLQAPTTRIVDLLDGGEELEASWHADARRLMRRAEREGTHVTISRQPDPSEIACCTTCWSGPPSAPSSACARVEFLRAAGRGARGKSGGWYLGIARVEGTPIAAMAFPRIGERAYYLYGALLRDPAYKHNYGSHAVMAAMLKSLAAHGCRSVDMWGVVEPDDADADPVVERLQSTSSAPLAANRCVIRASTIS